jgi:hypothetical protein
LIAWFPVPKSWALPVWVHLHSHPMLPPASEGSLSEYTAMERMVVPHLNEQKI